MNFFFSQPVASPESSNVSTIQVLRTGNFKHKSYGDFAITGDVMDTMLANFPGPDRLPIDYNHGSLSPNPEQSKAAGWIKSLVKQSIAQGFSLMAEVQWTNEAAAFIRNNQFRFVSPEFTFNWHDPESGADRGAALRAASLTNRPFLPAMAPVTLTEGGWAEDVADLQFAACRKQDETMALISPSDDLRSRVEEITSTFYRMYPDTPYEVNGVRSPSRVVFYVKEIYSDSVIVERESSNGKRLFQVFYRPINGQITFDAPEQWLEVRRVYQPVSPQMTDTGSTTTSERGAKMNEKILALLGLSKDATEDAIEGAVKTLNDKASRVEALEKDIEEIKAKMDEDPALNDDDEESIKLTEENLKLMEDLKTAQEQNVKLNERVDALELSERTSKADGRIDKALKDRKLLPAEVADEKSPMRTLALTSPDQFDAIVAARPAYDEKLLTLVTDGGDNPPEAKKDADPVAAYWALVDAESAKPESATLKLSDVRARVNATNPEAAKAAGITQ